MNSRHLAVAGIAVLPWLVAGALDLGGDGVVRWNGQAFLDACPFLAATGVPCPYCGMTRSFVALAHLRPVDAVRYNAAGALLLGAFGVVAVDRLGAAAGRPARIDLAAAAWFVLFWFGALAGVWAARASLGSIPIP